MGSPIPVQRGIFWSNFDRNLTKNIKSRCIWYNCQNPAIWQVLTIPFLGSFLGQWGLVEIQHFRLLCNGARPSDALSVKASHHHDLWSHSTSANIIIYTYLYSKQICIDTLTGLLCSPEINLLKPFVEPFRSRASMFTKTSLRHLTHRNHLFWKQFLSH